MPDKTSAVGARRQAETEPARADVLVVGGGIAGIHAALTLANAGKRVCLVERQPTIGGHMARFDRAFPSLDTVAGLLVPRMEAVGSHPNITLWTCSDVSKVDGHAGHFTVHVTRHPRFVNEDRCDGCLACIEACIYQDARYPDEFNLGLGSRKPVYLPFPQARPAAVVIDPDTCIAFKPDGCDQACVEACGDHGAIDFDQRDEVKEIGVAAIVLATGFQPFDVSRAPYYGYGTYPDVYTSLEVERLLNAAGPTRGEMMLRDGHRPRAIAIIHCVGSRDVTANRWCSRVCCMYSLKLAHLLKERTGAEVFNFYIDMRTPGKGFEEFYQKLLNEGVHFIRGRVAEVTDWAIDASEERRLVIAVEDTLLGTVRRVPVDMVVLSVGLEPQADAHEVGRLFNIACSNDGFFLEQQAKLAPVRASVEGIFLAGCCHGPKDIADTVAQAGAAAAEALVLIDGARVGSSGTAAAANRAPRAGAGMLETA